MDNEADKAIVHPPITEIEIPIKQSIIVQILQILHKKLTDI